MVVYFILLIKGKCLSTKNCWSVVRVSPIAPELEAPRVARIGLLVDAALSVVAAIHSGSEAGGDEPPGNLQTTTEAVLRPRKYARVFGRILYLIA